LNNIENKGEFDGLSQIAQMKNCAIRDAVAQRMCRMALHFWWGEATDKPNVLFW
jgi:hypothetical protein